MPLEGRASFVLSSIDFEMLAHATKHGEASVLVHIASLGNL